MRIQRIEIQRWGPLENIAWEPKQAEVIYDRNEEGKTALVDALISALFSQSTFPGANRFEETLEAQITVEHGTDSYIFPRSSQPRSVTEWLNWREPQLARLFCVRTGELELAARPETFDRLTDALADLLSGGGGKLDAVQNTVRNSAHLTRDRGDWSDARDHRVKSEVAKNLDRLRALQDARPKAIELEAKERERRRKEGERGYERGGGRR